MPEPSCLVDQRGFRELVALASLHRPTARAQPESRNQPVSPCACRQGLPTPAELPLRLWLRSGSDLLASFDNRARSAGSKPARREKFPCARAALAFDLLLLLLLLPWSFPVVSVRTVSDCGRTVVGLFLHVRLVCSPYPTPADTLCATLDHEIPDTWSNSGFSNHHHHQGAQFAYRRGQESLNPRPGTQAGEEFLACARLEPCKSKKAQALPCEHSRENRLEKGTKSKRAKRRVVEPKWWN